MGRRSKKSAAPRRKKPDAALREIVKMQTSTQLLIPRAAFARLVREIMYGFVPSDYPFRITAEALEALQEASELFLCEIFRDSVLCMAHRQRVTLAVKDMELAFRLTGWLKQLLPHPSSAYGALSPLPLPGGPLPGFDYVRSGVDKAIEAALLLAVPQDELSSGSHAY